MTYPYRTFQILPPTVNGRLYLVVDGFASPDSVLTEVLYSLSAPTHRYPIRLEPSSIHQHIWDGAINRALEIIDLEPRMHSSADIALSSIHEQLSNLRFECGSPSSSSPSSSSPGGSTEEPQA